MSAVGVEPFLQQFEKSPGRPPSAVSSETGETVPAIQIKNASKTYVARKETVRALPPVALDIADGEFVTIVGRSGCGKSTLLRMLAGIEAPTDGNIFIDGVNIRRPKADVRYVFQDYKASLFAWKTVGANISFGLTYPRRDKPVPRAGFDAEVSKHLSEVGLAGIEKRFPRELSGGMQQRVAIARALASQPKTLLLDEPFSAVDALSRSQLQDLLLGIWKEHRLTIVFVTHDIDEAVYMSDRVVVLGPGGKGQIGDHRINLPYHRDQLATRASEEFLAQRKAIYEQVMA